MVPPDPLVVLALLGCLLLPWLLPFVTGPLRLRSKSWYSADPVYTPDDDDCLPPEAGRMVADLRVLGFEALGIWRHSGNDLATGRLALLEHPRTLDTAKVLVVTTRGRETIALALQTRFEDGTEVVTANSRVTAGFPSPPGVTAAWLPEVRGAAELYQVHDQLRNALGGARRRLAVGNDPAAYLRAGAARVHANWLAAGYYYLDETRGVLRPTWKGAVLVAWRLLWPVKPLFRARRRRATRQLLLRVGVSPGG